MIKNKGLITLVGFLLLGLGFLALVLSLVGVQLAFLTWIDNLGKLVGFVIKLVMIMAGFIIIYLAQTDFSNEEV